MTASVRLFALVVLAYVASSAALPGVLRASIAVLAVLAAATSWRERFVGARRDLFAVLAVVLAGSALAYYEILANHHFVLTYAALLFALASRGAPEQDGETLRLGAGRLLAALMAVAAAQKLASPQYLDGSFFAHIFDIGALGGPIFNACPSCASAAAANVEAITAFVSRPPGAHEALAMRPVFGASAVSVWVAGRALAALVLVFEIWLACVYLWAPRHRAASCSLLIFVSGLALMRAEWVFGGLICVLGLAAAEPRDTLERRALSVACLIFVVLRVVTMI